MRALVDVVVVDVDVDVVVVVVVVVVLLLLLLLSPNHLLLSFFHGHSIYGDIRTYLLLQT